MNLGILSLVVGLLVFLGVFLIAYGISKRRVRLKERLESPGETSAAEQSNVYEKAAEMAKTVQSAVPRSEESTSRESGRLVQAGFRRKDAVYIYYGSRALITIGTALVLMITGITHNLFLILVIAVLLGAAVPDIWLRRRVAARQLAIQHGLPDMMDLAVVCVEAGMGLDQAVSRVGRELSVSHPELSDELNIYHLEIKAGKSREQALRNLGERTGVEDLKTLAAVLIQATRFGTSTADSLRIFSDDLRTKRRQRAEEAAAKMAIKMLGPLMLFIFPAIVLVVAGPAIIVILRDFTKALGQ